MVEHDRNAANGALVAVFDGLDRLMAFLVRAAEYATIAIAFFITIAMITGVFFRFVLNRSLGWTEETSSLLLAVMMFLVMGIGIHERLHISVGIVVDKLPLLGQRLFDIAIHLVCGVFFLVVAYAGLAVAQSGMAIKLSTVPLSRGVFFLAMPIGGAFAALACLNNIVRILRRWGDPNFQGVE